MLQVQGKDGPHALAFVVDVQSSAEGIEVVAQHGCATGPFAFATRGGHLVARAFGDDLALELGEGQQDVEDEASHGGRGVKLLRDADKGDAVLLERLHHLGKVQQRTT